MTELKRCPFCGGKVAIAEAGDYLTSWMLITRGNGKNGIESAKPLLLLDFFNLLPGIGRSDLGNVL